MTTPIIIGSMQETLVGHLLVATPLLQDGIFARSVVYMSSHDNSGAMGFIINSPNKNVDMQNIINQLNLRQSLGDRQMPVMNGGPVETHRGFVLHDGDYLQNTSLVARDGITVTANIQALTGWLDGAFTARAMLLLGYAGWGAGQLENEIEQGAWVSIPATKQLIFDTPDHAKWNVAVAALGFDLGNLSGVVGHA